MGAHDEGHLRVGARADLAVLTADLATILRADGEVAAIRSDLTMVDGSRGSASVARFLLPDGTASG